jgi:hypothetical protein
MFGSLHAGDVFYIENHIEEELTSFAAFRDFISRNSLNYDILAKIPHPISDITKIHWLENSLQRCPQFDIPIGTWKSQNTSVASRSYTNLVQYLSDQYSSLPADTPSRGGKKAFGASDDPGKNTQGQVRKRKRNRGKNGKGNGSNKGNDPKRKKQPQQAPQAHAVTASAQLLPQEPEYRNGWEEEPSAMAGQLHQWTARTPSISSTGSDPGAQRRVRTSAHRFYCAVHGFNTIHNGNVCRPMLDDPSTYTNQHLQAKKLGDCTNPAGNDNVQALRPRLHLGCARRAHHAPPPPSPAQRVRHETSLAVPPHAAHTILAVPLGSTNDPPSPPQRRLPVHNPFRVSFAEPPDIIHHDLASASGSPHAVRRPPFIIAEDAQSRGPPRYITDDRLSYLRRLSARHPLSPSSLTAALHTSSFVSPTPK